MDAMCVSGVPCLFLAQGAGAWSQLPGMDNDSEMLADACGTLSEVLGGLAFTASAEVRTCTHSICSCGGNVLTA